LPGGGQAESNIGRGPEAAALNAVGALLRCSIETRAPKRSQVRKSTILSDFETFQRRYG
jgi:hypothetical protein